jgi:hypothetical protein
MSELRSKARIFYNALSFDKPVNFGLNELIGGLDEEKYVENLHGEPSKDPVQELADQIELSDSAGAYLFTGNRGTGKTTELLRLATILRQDEYGCEVFYADMSEYLTLIQRIEVTDFLISVLGAFSEKIAARFGEDPGKRGYFERVRDFLINTNVDFTEVKLPAGPVEFKAALQQNPTFKEQLQVKTRGLVEQLVKQARDFATEAVHSVRNQRAHPERKVVLIVDSMERLRGVGDSDDVREVLQERRDGILIALRQTTVHRIERSVHDPPISLGISRGSRLGLRWRSHLCVAERTYLPGSSCSRCGTHAL